MKTYDITLTVTVKAQNSKDAVNRVSDAVWSGDQYDAVELVEFTNAKEVK